MCNCNANIILDQSHCINTGGSLLKFTVHVSELFVTSFDFGFTHYVDHALIRAFTPQKPYTREIVWVSREKQKADEKSKAQARNNNRFFNQVQNADAHSL